LACQSIAVFIKRADTKKVAAREAATFAKTHENTIRNRRPQSHYIQFYDRTSPVQRLRRICRFRREPIFPLFAEVSGSKLLMPKTGNANIGKAASKGPHDLSED